MKSKRILNCVISLLLLTVVSHNSSYAQFGIVGAAKSVKEGSFKKKLKETKLILSIDHISETDPLNAKSSEMFTINDDLYARIILPFKYGEYNKSIGRDPIEIQVLPENESKLVWLTQLQWEMGMDNPEESIFDIVLTENKMYNHGYEAPLSQLQDLWRTLEVGDTKLKFKLIVDDETIDEVEIIFRKNADEKILLGVSFDDLEKELEDPVLEEAILKCINKHAEKARWKKKFEEVKISSSDWVILYFPNGNIKGRTINAYIYATLPDGTCDYQEYTFQQQYTGSGYSDNVMYYTYVSGETSCDCKE
jgi:hypothetical protein